MSAIAKVKINWPISSQAINTGPISPTSHSRIGLMIKKLIMVSLYQSGDCPKKLASRPG